MSEETTKPNNTIMTAGIIALLAGIGYFAFSGVASTESDAIASVENDEVVEEVVVVAGQETTEVTAEMVVPTDEKSTTDEVIEKAQEAADRNQANETTKKSADAE
jgi:hypothetical protein